MLAFSYFVYKVKGVSKTRNLTVRLDEDTFREIERVAELDKSDKSTVARRLLAIGIREAKKDHALNMYRDGKCTLWKAAQSAGVPLREMMELAEEKRIPLHVLPEDVDEAWREAFKE